MEAKKKAILDMIHQEEVRMRYGLEYDNLTQTYGAQSPRSGEHVLISALQAPS